MDYLIRPFQPKDRATIRQLAVGTAEAGKKSSFRDLELLADHLTRYYTDVEPESTYVIDANNHVVGYLTGCLHTERYLTWFKYRGYGILIFRLLTRHLFHTDMWMWAWSRLKTLRAGGAHQRKWADPYPSHLHMNLNANVRGKGVGTALLNRFTDYARQANSRGIHLSTLTSNAEAQRFFSKNGFQKTNEVVAYRPEKTGFETVSVTIMTKPL